MFWLLWSDKYIYARSGTNWHMTVRSTLNLGIFCLPFALIIDKSLLPTDPLAITSHKSFSPSKQMKFTSIVLLSLATTAQANFLRSLGSMKPGDFPCVGANGDDSNCTCMGDDGYRHGEIANSRLYGCTAQDVKVAKAVVTGACKPTTNGGCVPLQTENGTPVCTEGDDILVSAQVYLWNNANSRRSDVGVWLSKTGKSTTTYSSANSGQCTHFFFEDPDSRTNKIAGKPILDNVDANTDMCGDMEGSQGKGVYDSNGNMLGDGPFDFVPAGGGSSMFPVKCTGSGFVETDACISYKVPGQDTVCDANGTDEAAMRLSTLPGTFSKCECSEITFPIAVAAAPTTAATGATPAVGMQCR